MEEKHVSGKIYALAVLTVLIFLCFLFISIKQEQKEVLIPQQNSSLRVIAKDNTVLLDSVSSESRDFLAAVINHSSVVLPSTEDLRIADGAITFYGQGQEDITALIWFSQEDSLLFYCENQWLLPQEEESLAAAECIRELLKTHMNTVDIRCLPQHV